MEEKVSIILATYNPNLDWFGEFLDSINNQDYSNYDLVVLDDASPNISKEELNEFIKKYINKINYKLYRNDINLGSNKTFEKLLSLTSSKYVAFADQDDIWHSNKLSRCVDYLNKSNKKMIYSDVTVIDEEGKYITDSITKFRKRFKFYQIDIMKHLLYKNFVIGCTIVMDKDFALSSTPFIDNIYHDQYLALYAANCNELSFINESLISYRIHKSNQTNPLANINSKEDYYYKKILKFNNYIISLSKRISNDEIDLAKEFSQARIANFNKEKGARKRLKKLSYLDKKTARFELFIMHNPILFKLIIKLIKNNKI